MKLFLQKKCKIFERWGLRPHTPVPPAAGGFAPKPPASGGWGLRPQTPIGLRRLGAPPPDPQNSPPHCEYLATRLWGITGVRKPHGLDEQTTSEYIQSLYMILQSIRESTCCINEYTFVMFLSQIKIYLRFKITTMMQQQ